jgi:hypothetical protein
LKNGPGNYDCNGFLKNFASAAKIVTKTAGPRFCTLIQKLGVERRTGSIATHAKSQTAMSNHGLSEITRGVFLTRSRRPWLS